MRGGRQKRGTLEGDRQGRSALAKSPSYPSPASCLPIVTIDNKIFHSKRLEFGLCRGTAARGSFVAKYPGIQHTMRTAGRPKCHKIGHINSVAAAFSVIFRCAEAKTEQVDFGETMPMNFGPISGQVYTFFCFMGRVIGSPKLWLFVSNAANLECMRGRKEKANIYSPHSAVNTNIPVLNGPVD